MKNRQKQPGTISKDELALLRSQKAHKALQHILSPLELAAIKSLYQPFTYTYNRTTLYVNESDCKHLAWITRQKINLINGIIYKDNHGEGIPVNLRKAFTDPREVLAFPSRLRNVLINSGCSTLLDIILKGRSFFLEDRKLSKHSLSLLDALFLKYRCIHLFQ